MKLIKFILLFTLATTYCEITDAQDYSKAGYDVLGTWCYISVDMQNDPVVDGCFVYTIPCPNEGVGYGSVQGPGAPFLFNHLGNTIDIHINKMKLQLDAEGYDSVPIEFFVDRWLTNRTIPVYSSYPKETSSPLNGQCYYYIILNIKW